MESTAVQGTQGTGDKKAGKSRKKLIIAVIIIAAVAVAGVFGFFRLQAMTGQTAQDVPSTYMLKKTDLESKVTASGNFASTDPVSVGSNVQGGEVEEVFVEAGSQVYAGEMLAKLKTSDIERSITDTRAAIAETAKGDTQKKEQAQRAFDEANDQYYHDLDQNNKAVEKAQKEKDAAKKARDKAKAAAEADPGDPDLARDYTEKAAAYKAAQNALDAATQQRDNTNRANNSRWYDAKAQLDALQGTDSARQQRSQLDSLNDDLANASIVSPITGIVTRVSTEAGKSAMGDMFTIEDTEALQISATVAEYDVIKVEKGMKAHITSNATGEQVYDGVVDFVAPTASDTNGNFEVKVLVTSQIGQLKPGMTATIEIVTASKNDIFIAPIDAVVTLPDGRKVVYAYEPGAIQASTLTEPSGDGAATPRNRIAGGGQRPAGGTTRGRTPVGGGAPGAADSAPFSGSRFLGNTAADANDAGADLANRREIEVTTGMETDYYIEISGEGLVEGMLILSDPLSRSVNTGSTNMFGMMDPGPGGGQVMGGGPAGGSATYVTVDAGP